MKVMKLALSVLASVAISHVAQAAADYSDSAANELQKTGPNTLERTGSVEARAQVIKIDKKTREITFKPEDGENVTVVAGPEIRNFDQIKKGDTLKVNYMESLVLELKKKQMTDNGVVASTDIVRSAPGEKPGGQVTQQLTATGTVTKIDKKKQEVTVKGPRRTISFHVKDQSVLDELKKGDQIEAKYTEALAVSVETIKR
jgi:Cu/Ag efflux protein CusF